MLQSHSFFANPLIYFGPHLSNEEEESEEEGWSFDSAYPFSQNPSHFSANREKIGLFFLLAEHQNEE